MFHWKNRREFVQRCGIRAYQSFVEVQKWIEDDKDELFLMYGKISPSVNLLDVIDGLIDQYATNIDDFTIRQIDRAKKDILVEMYEMARISQNKEAMEWARGEER